MKDSQTAHRAVTELLVTFEVCTLDMQVLKDALLLPGTDYEDAVQIASAVASHLDCIVTRNVSDYVGNLLPVYSPTDFVTKFLEV